MSPRRSSLQRRGEICRMDDGQLAIAEPKEKHDRLKNHQVFTGFDHFSHFKRQKATISRKQQHWAVHMKHVTIIKTWIKKVDDLKATQVIWLKKNCAAKLECKVEK